MLVLKDAWDVIPLQETIINILKTTAYKHGLRPQDLYFKRVQREPDHIIMARDEFCYLAYRTGRYSLAFIAETLHNRKKWRRNSVDRCIKRHCKRHGIKRPRWGLRTKPWERITNVNIQES